MPNRCFVCGGRNPKMYGCVDCGTECCDLCVIPTNDELVCGRCKDARLYEANEELPEPECTCIEERVDVDRTVAYGPCDIHFPVRPE